MRVILFLYLTLTFVRIEVQMQIRAPFFPYRVAFVWSLLLIISGDRLAEDVQLQIIAVVADFLVGILGIVLSDVSLQPGRIEDGHGSLITINFLKDRLSQVHEGIEEQLQVIDEFLLEPGDFRSIENSSRRILAGP